MILRGAFLSVLMGWVVVAAADAQTLPTSEECRDCHLGLEDEALSAPARSYESDIHAEVGFGCLACHGSGAGDELNPAAGFLSAPVRREVPGMCGRCHSDAAFMRQFDPGLRVDQVTEYWTSRHGQRLRDFDDPDVATCIDCHSAHEIRPPDDPESTVFAANIVETCGSCHSDGDLMAGRGIGTDQVDAYRSSVHGTMLFDEGDLSAPVCNDCHGNHGAAPPGVSSVRNVCGQCHSVMADYFDQSGHDEIFQQRDLAGCALCHGHHEIQPVSDETLLTRSEDVCLDCHVPPDTLGLEFEKMAAALDSLEAAEEASRQLLEEAENLGMEVSQAFFELEEVGNAQTRAHSAIHTFQADAVREEARAGLTITAAAEEQALAALDEHGFRQTGLAIFAGIVVLLIAGLLMKIHEAEERMEELISQVSTFYERTLMSWEGGHASEQQLRLAAAALMLEVCHADGELSPEEREYLEDLARKRFDLQGPEAEELIDLGERERGVPGQLDRIAAMIAAEFSLERKWVLLDELWALACIDGDASPKEVEFLERLAYLLGVGSADSAAARERGAAAAGMTDDETGESA